MTVLIERVHQVLQGNPKKLKSKAKTVFVLQEHHKNFQGRFFVSFKHVPVCSQKSVTKNMFVFITKTHCLQ